MLMQAIRRQPSRVSGSYAGDGRREPAEDGRQVSAVRKRVGWVVSELEARGKGKAPDLEKDLRANLLPGITIVPAMVIAIEKAQEAGIRYNRRWNRRISEISP